jgi:hypothetical protein
VSAVPARILFAILLVSALQPALAHADRNYSMRFGAVERGDVAILANTSMSCPSAIPSCAGARAGTGPIIRNSAYVMTHVDVDADASTFNSSSADLTLPAGATVLFAGLYWGSDTLAGTGGVDAPSPVAKGSVLFASDAARSYQSVLATRVDTSERWPSRFQGFADVTQQVRAAGSSTYTVANVQAATGNDNFGGWGMVVAYRDPAKPVRWLGVYDGFLQFTDLTRRSATLTGFRTPETGIVDAAFGSMTYEGDLAVTGDVMRINGRDVTDGLHPAGNYWNSQITEYGQHVLAREPAYINQLGHESSVIDIDGHLPNGATSAAIHMENVEDYLQTGPMTLVADQAAAAPSATASPAIAGEARDGSTLTAAPGTWSGTTPMAYAYQWRRCDASGAACADVAGATGPGYAVTAADAGRALRVRVTATNVVGASSATSAATAAVPGAPPVNSVAPSISGVARDGETLTAAAGTWSGAPRYDHQWQRCGTVCADVVGADGATYVLGAADVGATMRVRVTATTADGSADALSAATAAVAARAPASSGAPTVSGTAREGETLTAAAGTWSGTAPISKAYRWRRCDTTCADIPGAGGSTYTLTAADVGRTLRVRVTGANAAGTATADSDPTDVVVEKPPAAGGAPLITGAARDGETLTVQPGTWTGSPSFAYRWRRCDAEGTGCAGIDGATGATYVLTPADVGSTLRAIVTGSNSGGTASSVSGATSAVLPRAPANSAAPGIAGTPRDGETLTAATGTWTGNPTFTYRWRRCAPACADAGTGPTYLLTPDDVAATIRLRVTATNAGGSTTAESDPTAAVAARPPVAEIPPGIGGTSREGQTLSATPGTWSGTPGIEYAYRWRRCNASGAACADVAGAVTTEHALTAADVGSTLRVRVVATNAGGSAAAESDATPVVTQVGPSSAAPPTVSGTAREGETLTASPGTWSGSPSFAYQWRRCSGEGCADVAGATSATYALGAADVGRTIRVHVTAANAGGSAAAESAATKAVVMRAPVSTAAPVIAGTAREGETLTATAGEWQGAETVAHQWQRCASACEEVVGATGTRYVLGPEDVGRTIRVRVAATNPGGSSFATSKATGAIEAKPEVPDPDADEPPVAPEPSPTPQPRTVVEPPPGAAPQRCGTLTATYTGGRTGTLRLVLRLTGPIENVQFGIPAALRPTRAATGRRAAGRLVLAGATGPARTTTLRFRPGTKLALTPGRAPGVRLIRSGARVSGLVRSVRRIELTLVTRGRAPQAGGLTVEAMMRTAAGRLERATCAL